MSRRAQQIFEEASQLPPDEVDWLIESLLIKEPVGKINEESHESEAVIEAAWDDEIKRRLDEIDSGAVEMIPGEQVREEMLRQLSPQARARLRA